MCRILYTNYQGECSMWRIYLLAFIALSLLPINSWAFAKKFDIYSPGSGYSLVHGNTYIPSLAGTIRGKWDEAAGKLYSISGFVKGNGGWLQIAHGYLNSDGSGLLFGQVHKNTAHGSLDYFGGIYYRDSGWYGGPYDNILTDNYLKIWGDGIFAKFYTPDGSNNTRFKGFKKLGTDLYGHGQKVSEPATWALLIVGLFAMAYARRRRLFAK